MRGYNLRNVEIFATGVHRGKPYTEADIDDIVRNFKNFSTGERPLLKVPAVVGHEEKQPLTENSGIPKIGNPTAIWKENQVCRWCSGTTFMEVEREKVPCPACQRTGTQTILRADFDEVPEKIAKLINGRAYDQVSAEIYDKPPEGVPGQGMMLRRVAFLGGDLPHIKSLDDLPLTDYEAHGELAYAGRPVRFRLSEKSGYQTKHGSFQLFSEVRQMSRDEMIAAMVEKGGIAEHLQAMSDDMLTGVYKMIEKCSTPAQPAPVEGQMAELDSPIDEVKPTPDDKNAMTSYRELAAKLVKYTTKRFGESFKVFTEETTKPTPEQNMKPEQFSELVTKVTAEVTKQVLAGIQPVQKDLETLKTLSKAQKVREFCEARLKSGHIDAAELDAGPDTANPGYTLFTELMQTDDVTTHRFAEGTKMVNRTTLENKMAQIDRRQAHRFGEKIKGSELVGDDVAKVESYYEANRQAFTKAGRSKEEFVEIWKKAPPADRAALLRLQPAA